MANPATKILLRSRIREQFQHSRRNFPVWRSQFNNRKLPINSLLRRYPQCARIAIFWPHQNELSPLHTLISKHSSRHRLYLPRMLPGYQSPVFVRWFCHRALRPGRWKIQEPAGRPVPTASLDLILVPLVAFDNLGNRLGRGGGVYDRLFEKIGSKPAIPLVGVAHSWQQTDSIPAMPWDLRLDSVLTERGLYHRQNLST